MKHLKAKLMMSVMSLVLATIMMTTVSFAWFTISTAPEISDITTSVTANGNLEIALDAGSGAVPADSTAQDAGKNETWGNLVDLKGYFNPTGSANVINLKPVSVTWSSGVPTFSRPVFGYDGRIASTSDLTRNAVDDGGSDNFKDFGGVFSYGEAETDKTGDGVWCFEVDYWLRSNVANNVSLSVPAMRGDAASEYGLGSWISDKTITVKIVDGATVYTAVPAETTTNINGADVYALTLKDEAGESAATIALTANTAKLVKMYVYMDGAGITNATFANTSANGAMSMNVQFVGDATLTAMAVNESGYQRGTANGGSTAAMTASPAA